MFSIFARTFLIATHSAPGRQAPPHATAAPGDRVSLKPGALKGVPGPRGAPKK